MCGRAGQYNWCDVGRMVRVRVCIRDLDCRFGHEHRPIGVREDDKMEKGSSPRRSLDEPVGWHPFVVRGRRGQRTHMDLIRARTCTSRVRVSAAMQGRNARTGASRDELSRNADDIFRRQVPASLKNLAVGTSQRLGLSVSRPHSPPRLPAVSHTSLAMPVEVRILHGGDIACEVASVLARVLLSQSPTTKTKTFQIADYPDAGFDIVAVTGQESTGEDRGDAESTAVVAVKDDTSHTHNVDVTGVAVTCEDRGDAESTGVVAVKDGTAHPDNNTNGVFFVFVVETGEFENPADGAVSFIRDLMAACGKTRKTTKVWEARRVFKDDYARGRGGASDGAYFPLNTFRLRD
jgi:hypothetical protein